MGRTTAEILGRFRSSAAARVRKEIEKAAGREVFLVGKLDDDLKVREVEVCARGSRAAVPAVFKKARPGEVLIHNHPGSDLTPSDADLSLAARAGEMGMGFLIVDDAVEDLYEVVAPFPPTEPTPLDPEELDSLLSRGGALSEVLGGYEDRPEQRRMTAAVSRALNENRITVVEAGTGTGKSLAYLIPFALWCMRNGERVVVSTYTINLQEQLVEKDLPLLSRLPGFSFRYCLVKGRSNYLCLLKLDAAAHEMGLFEVGKEKGEIVAIAAWAQETADGSLSDLSFVPSDDVWEGVCCEQDRCLRLRCPFYEDCFLYAARRRASAANLLVTNHHLLMADLAVKKQRGSYATSAVLPPFERVLFDEAHNLEDVATSYMSFTVSRAGVRKLLGRLLSMKKGRGGLLRYLGLRLGRTAKGRPLSVEIDSVTVPEIDRIRERVEEILEGLVLRFERFAKENGEEGGMEGKIRVIPSVREKAAWREKIDPALRELSRELGAAAHRLDPLLRGMEGLPEKTRNDLSSPLLELRSLRGRLEGYAGDLISFLQEDPAFCRWVEFGKRKRRRTVRFCSAPLSVSEGLRKFLFDRFRTVVLTSATLAVAGRFEYLRGRLGLEEMPSVRLEEQRLPSSFDFRKQAFVAVPRDVPDPRMSGFPERLEKLLLRTASISKGGAFFLFTSYRLLDRLYEKMKEALGELGFPPMRQGEENRRRLLARFKRVPDAVLFATDSFWQGVDVRGDTLRCVAITRLPFRVPTEPIHQARAEAIEKAEGDPFREYVLPQAVLKFKQGFGRLIRSRKDRGAVLIFDSRIVSKSYGSVFLRSLPDMDVMVEDGEKVFRAMERFFRDMASGDGRRRGDAIRVKMKNGA